jgi:hypothetical protein
MFEFRRLFPPAFARSKQSLAGDESALLELLDVKLLAAEAQAAEITAGRPGEGGGKNAQLRQSAAWRELARRTGDVLALRRAASAAERALHATASRPHAARLEQGLCALRGVDMFGDEGLEAAADQALLVAAGGTGLVKAVALGKRTFIAARQALVRGNVMDALAALTGYDAPRNILKVHANTSGARLAIAEARTDRAVLTVACGQLLKSDAFVARGAADLAEVIAALDPAYHPLTWSRASMERSLALVCLGELNGDLSVLSEAVEDLSRVFDILLKDHSPLDWAAAQAAHGEALWAMARVGGVRDAYVKASGAYDRAWSIVRNEPALKMRASVGERRGALAVWIATTHADPLELAAVEAGFRCDLAAADPHRDAVGWAVCQLNLGRVYMARGKIGRSDPNDRARAALAILEAQTVFNDYQLVGIAEIAGQMLITG